MKHSFFLQKTEKSKISICLVNSKKALIPQIKINLNFLCFKGSGKMTVPTIRIVLSTEHELLSSIKTGGGGPTRFRYES